MRNNACIMCGQEFVPREGKLYCSNACKQKGYSDKKQQIGEQHKREQEIKAVSKQFEFYFSEFQEFNKEYPDYMSNIQLYCFFRKNLRGNPTIEQIHEYIQSFSSSWWNDFWDNDGTGIISPARKKYLEFEARYFGDEIIISFSKEDNLNA